MRRLGRRTRTRPDDRERLQRYSREEARELLRSGQPFCAFDIEHSGTQSQAIVEIGAIRVDSSGAEEVFESMIFLEPRRFSSYARRKTGIKPEELRAGAPREETLARFRDFLEGSVPVLHAANDDLLTVNRNLSRLQLKPVPAVAVDVQVWARQDFELEGLSLEAIATHFGVSKPTHRALADARTTLEIFQRMLGALA